MFGLNGSYISFANPHGGGSPWSHTSTAWQLKFAACWAGKVLGVWDMACFKGRVASCLGMGFSRFDLPLVVIFPLVWSPPSKRSVDNPKTGPIFTRPTPPSLGQAQQSAFAGGLQPEAFGYGPRPGPARLSRSDRHVICGYVRQSTCKNSSAKVPSRTMTMAHTHPDSYRLSFASVSRFDPKWRR